MKYTNKNGNVIMHGCGSGRGARIITVTGLGIPKRSYKTIEFASENGVTQTSEKDMVRTITITADVVGDKSDCRSISKVFHEQGELYITSDEIRRKIKCKCTQPPEFKRLGTTNIYTFTVQLQADYPYFTEFYNINKPVYKIEDNITESFTLPSVFTKRISRADINNVGDKKVYPEIKITNQTDENAISIMSTENLPADSLVIENHTTGAKIIINHIMENGETIILNLPERKIVSDYSGDITCKVDDTTILADFYIDIGVNDISFVNTNVGSQNLAATVIYSPEYYSVEV